ncbi:MAG: hypothetical protein NVS2B14_17330 [Chamaesiphon sp.]
MTNSSTTVLIIHLSPLQRVIWQKVLQSQSISVIAQSKVADPSQALIQIEQTGMPLPDLLLIDTQLPSFNPETFCKWCGMHYPTLKIILLSGFQKPVSPSERQTAIDSGAYDFLPAFHMESLTTGAIAGVKSVLAALPVHAPLHKELLVSSLMALKREMDSRKLEKLSIAQNHETPSPGVAQDQGHSQSLSLKNSASTEHPLESTPEIESPSKKAPKRKYRGATY